MEYLKKYDLTDEDIMDITQRLDDDDRIEIELNEPRVTAIIDYLLSIGITNLKDILIYKTNIFYDGLDSLKDTLSECDTNMIALLNADVFNFDLIGI